MAYIGLLTWSDDFGPGAFSGSPYSIQCALQRLGHDLVNIEAGPTRLPESTPRSRRAFQRIPPAAQRVIKGIVGPISHRRSRTLNRLRRAAAAADRNIDRLSPELVVGVKSSQIIGLLKTTRPILYISDATAAYLLPQYQGERWKGRGYRKVQYELESLALQRADHTMLYFQRLVDSAINDHGAAPERVSTNYPGSNLIAAKWSSMDRPLPSRDRLNLLIVASDPIRKRLQFAVEVIEILQARGWNARGRYIGPEHPAASNSPYIDSLGRLRLDDPADRAIHTKALEASHVNLLPSTGDMMPLSVQEAGSFGVPSIVTDVGGLPESISDRETGRVLCLARTPEEWAEAVEWCVEDSIRYQKLSRQTSERAHTVFTWDAWAERASPVIEGLIRR